MTKPVISQPTENGPGVGHNGGPPLEPDIDVEAKVERKRKADRLRQRRRRSKAADGMVSIQLWLQDSDGQLTDALIAAGHLPLSLADSKTALSAAVRAVVVPMLERWIKSVTVRDN